MFLNKATDDSNLDLKDGRTLEYYLELTKDYKHDFSFVIKDVEGFKVVDDGEFDFGTKAKMADFFISRVQEESLVYVCPRTGYAPFSLCYLAKKYNKKLLYKKLKSQQMQATDYQEEMNQEDQANELATEQMP